MNDAEYRDLLEQIKELTLEDCQVELLDAARYNDIDIVRALLASIAAGDQRRSLVNHQQAHSGHTALHMAAVNGHVDICQQLVEAGADLTLENAAGNTALHWAAANGQEATVAFLLAQSNVDVLKRNKFGRSALTEGFSSDNSKVVESLLEHESASEERLLETSGAKGQAPSEPASTTHAFCIGSLKVSARECVMAESKSDTILGDVDAFDMDTTGLGIWPASIVAARWMAEMDSCPSAKSMVELGAGCGLPSLVLAKRFPKAKVYASDLNPTTVDNLRHNLQLNQLSNATASAMDWQDPSTYPEEQVDVLVGSDLIYQSSMVDLLVTTIHRLLKCSSSARLFYVAPDSGRQGQDEFLSRMKERFVVKSRPAADDYRSNPLASEDDEECFLHFHELSSMNFVLHEFQWRPELLE